MKNEPPEYSIFVEVSIDGKKHGMKDFFEDEKSLDKVFIDINKCIRAMVDNSKIFGDKK